MTEEGRKIDSTHPWPGLAYYTEDAEQFFFGRDDEAEEVLKLMRVEPIGLLFGKSGLGKTSLLLAGVFPKLRAAGFLPVYIRIGYDDDDPTPDEQILGAVRKAALDSNLYTIDTAENATVYNALGSRQLKRDSDEALHPNVALVFDQFEEIFTLGNQSSYAQPIIELIEGLTGRSESLSLAELTFKERTKRELEGPLCRVLLSVREDFLADLDILCLRLPALGYNRFRLGPLKGEQALGAINGPALELMDQETSFTILDAVSAFKFDPMRKPPAREDLLRREVNPALLSLICTQLNETRIRLEQKTITSAIVKTNRETILDEFFEQSFKGLKESIRVFVENELVTNDGYRRRASLADALLVGSERDFDLLEDRRLIRRYEESKKEIWVELTHDLLVDAVLRSRRERLLARRRRKAFWKWAQIAGALCLFAVALVVYKYYRLTAELAKQTAQAQIGANAKRQSSRFLELAKDAVKTIETDPTAKANALALLSRALQRDDHNIEAAELTCNLLLGNTWCPPLTPPLRYTSDSPLLCATFAPKETAQRVLALSQDGWLLGSGNEGAALDRIKNLKAEENHSKVVFISSFFSADGRELLVVPPPLNGSGPVSAQFWKLSSNSYQRLETIQIKDVAPINTAVWSNDGRLLIYISGRWDRPPTCQVFYSEGGEYVDISSQLFGFQTIVAAINPSGDLVATGSADGKIQLWRWDGHALEKIDDGPEGKGLLALAKPARPYFIAFGPQPGEIIVAAFGQSQTGVAHILSRRQNVSQREVASRDFKDQFMRFIFSPENAPRQLVATALFSRIVINDVNQLNLEQPIAEPLDIVGTTGVPVFSSNGKDVLTLSGSVWVAMDTVQVWDVGLKFTATPNYVFNANNTPAPDWLADLARTVSGIPRTWVDEENSPLTISAIRQRTTENAVPAPYKTVWRHFFSP
jgi:WD40 repeat protein